MNHRDAQEALPWLANGSLAGAELEGAEAHLLGCAHCREELAILRALRAAGPGPAPQCDPEQAFARLLPRLDALPAAPAATPAPAPGMPGRWRGRLAANDRSWLRAAVALQCCLAAMLAVLLLRPAANEGSYRALGASAPAAQAAILVVFRPETPERELRRIVRASGARIVGGPTALDAYLMEANDAPSAVARLRAEPAVTLAEPLGMEGRP